MMPAIKFEKRMYDASCSREEFQQIKDNVKVIEPGVIRYREMPTASPFSVRLMFAELEAKSLPYERFIFMVDLTSSSLPSSEVRQALRLQMERVIHRIDHCAFYTGRNVLINVAVEFVMFKLKLPTFSVSKNEAEALKKVRNANTRL